MTNKQFAEDFLALTKKIVKEVSDIDPQDQNATVLLAKAQLMGDAIKQANNTFRSCLQHDIASAKIEGYRSTFLDNEE